MTEKFKGDSPEEQPKIEDTESETEQEKYEKTKWEKYNKAKQEGTWTGPPPREKTGYIPEDEFSFKSPEEMKR
mgnify:CR=1 FL=1